MKWKSKVIAITGGGGFVGSWLSKKMVDLGCKVVVLDKKTDNLEVLKIIDKVTIKNIDILNSEDVANAIRKYNIEFCFHLAASAIVQSANALPYQTIECNVRGTWNVLEACRKSEIIEGLIIASSDKAYGEHKMLPYSEESPLLGRNPYDASKACGDIISQAYYQTYKIPLAISRCGNIYGGGDLNFSRIVPGTIRSVLKGERPVIRSDGKYLRDYIFIDDIIDAYTLLAEKVRKRSIVGEAFNFGINDPQTVLEIVHKILKIIGSKLKPIIQNEAAEEIRKQYLSSKKARKVLGWKPKVPLDEGLIRTIEWYKEFFMRDNNEKF